MNNVWTESGSSYRMREISQQLHNLPVAIYKIQVGAFGEHYLEKIQEEFVFPYKIYGIEDKFIRRVIKTYHNTSGNMGVLLNGIKGTGKTVTAELICNQLNLPVIIVPGLTDGLIDFLNDMNQDIVVFIDEFEKVFQNGSSSVLLSIMDGAMKTENRLVFIMTTNNLHIDSNLLQRPSRVRYLKTFGDLELPVIMEVVDDMLHHKEYYDDTVKFISEMPIITMDLVKAVIEEVNIHDESPYEFKDVFNIHEEKESYMNVYITIGDKKKLFKEQTHVSHRYLTSYNIGQYFCIGHQTLGTIKQVLPNDQFIVETCMFVSYPSEDFSVTTEISNFFNEYKKYNGGDKDDFVIEPMDVLVTMTPAVRTHKSFASFSLAY